MRPNHPSGQTLSILGRDKELRCTQPGTSGPQLVLSSGGRNSIRSAFYTKPLESVRPLSTRSYDREHIETGKNETVVGITSDKPE